MLSLCLRLYAGKEKEIQMERLTRIRFALPLAGVLLAGALAVTAALAGPQAKAGPYRVELTTDPAVIPVGKADLILKITDAAHKPVEGAEVRVLAQMRGMAMGEREERALPERGEPGTYVAPAQFAMEGAYTTTVKISGPRGDATATMPLRTGQNTALAGGSGHESDQSSGGGCCCAKG